MEDCFAVGICGIDAGEMEVEGERGRVGKRFQENEDREL